MTSNRIIAKQQQRLPIYVSTNEATHCLFENNPWKTKRQNVLLVSHQFFNTYYFFFHQLQSSKLAIYNPLKWNAFKIMHSDKYISIPSSKTTAATKKARKNSIHLWPVQKVFHNFICISSKKSVLFSDFS